jgi:signal transduction histidine kinase
VVHVAAVRALLVAPAASAALRPVPSQGRLLDAFDAERARIERDLHDGTQQRLVALTVMLDVARMRAGDEPTRELLTKAHREATATLTELRELVQGIHPHVLTARGLRAAVGDLVSSYPLRVDTRIDIAGRLPSSVESTAFFVISEALANVAKHSGASRARVSATVVRDVLQVEVTDTGRGGASVSSGSGVQGVADRVAAVGGQVLLSSPEGGPTVLRAEIPCGTP